MGLVHVSMLHTEVTYFYVIVRKKVSVVDADVWFTGVSTPYMEILQKKVKIVQKFF